MKNKILECIEEIEGNLICIRLDIDNRDCDYSTQQEMTRLEEQLEKIKELLNNDN